MRLAHGEFLGKLAHSCASDSFSFSELLHTSRVAVPTHTHEDAHFLFVLGGDYFTSARALMPAAGGPRLIFNPAGTTHRDRFQSASGHFLTASVLPGKQSAVYPTENALTQPVAFGSSWLTGIALRMYEEFHRADALSALVLEGLCLELYAFAARDAQPAGRGRAPGWFARALELIQDRCCEPLTIREIAHEVGVHPYHLARVSRRYTGKTPGDVLRDCRMQKAARLLSHSSIPIGTIALTCGYADQSQFTRSFGRAFGMSPGSFRRASVRQGTR